MRQLKILKQITSRDTPSLDKYLQEISKIELLTPEQEVELAKNIRIGCEKSLNRMVKANLRFVVSVSKQYQNQGLNLQDLINEGNVGLIKAAQRFDETRGFKFISYAVWWIRQSILQSLAENARIVRLPLNKIGSINKINKTFSMLENEYEREPTSEEIAQIMDIAPNEVKELIKSTRKCISMDAPVSHDEDTSLSELFESEESNKPDDGLILESLKKEILRILSTLSQREANVLKLFFGLNGTHEYSLEEIGQEFGLTRERVRQIKEKAILRLKNTSRSKILKKYLG